MATHLRIHSLTVATARDQRTFTFDSPLTFITGATAIGKSTLLMLVSAFAGSGFIRRAYEEAIRERYRFYSYGDCMLIV